MRRAVWPRWSTAGALVLLVGCGQVIVPSPTPSATGGPVPTASAPDLTPVPTPDASGIRLVGDGSVPERLGFWDSQTGLVTGQAPNGTIAIARTVDGGHSFDWIPIDAERLGDPSVWGTQDAIVVASCGADAAIDCAPGLLATDDAGRTWSSVAGPEAGRSGLRQISFAGGVGWAVAILPPGDLIPDPNGTVLRRTLDGGATWAQLPDPCEAPWSTLEDVRFVDARNGWIVCSTEGSGTMAPTAIYVTRDGAKTFVIRSSSDFSGPRNLGRAPSGPVGAIEAADMTTAFVMEGRSGTERTTDGGVRWAPTPPGDPEIVFVDSMSATLDGTVFAIAFDGNAQMILVEASADRGATWEHRAGWPRD